MTEPHETPSQKRDALEVKAEMLTCRHFNGVQHDCCLAGVNYRALAGEPELGCMTRIPCAVISEPKGGPMAVCERRDTWNRDEAEQRVGAHRAALDAHVKALKVAHEDAKTKGFGRNHGGVSQCQCPLCSGILRYSVSSYNGHMHAQCETEGCVQWME